MDASPILRDALGALNRARLEAVMIGNAAAALHGAPVTTIDVDFMFRDTRGNMRKLKAVARELGAVIMRPYYPVSKLYRLTHDDRGLQLDFMPAIHGIRSFERTQEPRLADPDRRRRRLARIPRRHYPQQEIRSATA